jgi:hypothetical protein
MKTLLTRQLAGQDMKTVFVMRHAKSSWKDPISTIISAR